MKKSIKIFLIILLSILAVSFIVYLRLQPPLHELNYAQPYEGVSTFNLPHPAYDETKTTILIVADNDGTEMFDMMAPYYLFNVTGMANVYIAAPTKYPITMRKGPYILPHFTYTEIDSLKIYADVIVIPYMDQEPESPVKTNWIKKHYGDSTYILSICDGAWTAAATGLYNGKPLTAHATDYENIKKRFSKPLWVQGVTYTQSGRLFSTAGVSNATDGSLAVIRELFGREVMIKVLKDINYRYPELQKGHNSIALNNAAIIAALNKMLFSKNKKLGVLLQDGMSEIELAAIFDTYHRTLPSSMHAYSINNASVATKYGLTLLPTANFHSSEIDELETMNAVATTKTDSMFKNISVVNSHSGQSKYIIEECLDKIEAQYGSEFKNLVKLSLDYN